jgi:pyruvate,water dikinase
MTHSHSYVRWFDDLGTGDVPTVGGKNASLGEMVRTLAARGIRVPAGFATTAEAFREFIAANDLERRMRTHLADLDRGAPLDEVGRAIRDLILGGELPEPIAQAIREAYRALSSRYHMARADVAVRSSATAEDLPEASFAGQQETFLNVTGERDLLDASRRCYASLFTDRAIAYRIAHGFDHMSVALSVGVQKMVRSDLAGAGVMFSIDTESGFPHAVVIDASWGLGENVVKGTVTPDGYLVFKPLLAREGLSPIIAKTLGDKQKKLVYARGGTASTENLDTSREERARFVLDDAEVLQLARWACAIEEHYGRPMDMEWAKDGTTSELFIVQARPETVQSRREATSLKTYELAERAKPLLTGLAVGQAIASGHAVVLHRKEEIAAFEAGGILVTEMTDPDWVPIMKKAAGIVTDAGGRTSHAAIVSRELGLPAVIGTGRATQTIRSGQPITISCAEGSEGHVYDGRLRFDEHELDLEHMPVVRTQIMMNLASPDAAFRWWRLPARGIGLARMEFIISNAIKVHPMALLHVDRVQDPAARAEIERLTRGYPDKAEYFVERLARGIAMLGAAGYPHDVIVRMSDFKSNEYANLIGGQAFELHEANPMLGLRGASRYTSERYREAFDLECRAVRRVREEMGLANVLVMIPFCRTLDEADRTLEALARNGLERGKHGLEVYVMAEIPSNIILAGEFARRFDGFSIGSNDLTQLVLGVDRDSAELAHLFDERNEAVKQMIRQLIAAAHAAGTKVGICGQAPSDYPEFAEFLVREGIDSISLNPDTIVRTIRHVAEVETLQQVGTRR